MHVESDRSFHFDLPPPALWRAVSEVDSYPRWWPWLQRFDARRLAPGEVWDCAVKPPLPYLLRFRLHIGEVVPARRVTARADGDLVGDALLDIEPADRGSALRLRSTLAPDTRWLRHVAHLAGPVMRIGHDWVLDTGARQFAAAGRSDTGHRLGDDPTSAR